MDKYEYIKQLEEIDKYLYKHNNSKILELIIEKVKLEYIKSYLELVNKECPHCFYTDIGYYDYINDELIEQAKENAKYHVIECTICNRQIVLTKTNNKWENKISNKKIYLIKNCRV